MRQEKVWLVADEAVNLNEIRGVVYNEKNAPAIYKDPKDQHFQVLVEDSRMENYDDSNLEVCTCKYNTPEMKPKLQAIVIMIHALYEMDGCSCGGICHIVTDDDNFDDHSLNVVISECHKKENQDRPEIELAEAICLALKKLSLQERALVFSSFYTGSLCDNDHKCEGCWIERGENI